MSGLCHSAATPPPTTTIVHALDLLRCGTASSGRILRRVLQAGCLCHRCPLSTLDCITAGGRTVCCFSFPAPGRLAEVLSCVLDRGQRSCILHSARWPCFCETLGARTPPSLLLRINRVCLENSIHLQLALTPSAFNSADSFSRVCSSSPAKPYFLAHSTSNFLHLRSTTPALSRFWWFPSVFAPCNT